ncbi:EpsG family protein [Marinobacter denitrificans]|uniref:EpsG family protein n=1 Tax=Marinobacter TaxID=2742 RepID=UPI001246F0D2|nr:EpsG family protein [Marinobacter sp. JB05H06]
MLFYLSISAFSAFLIFLAANLKKLSGYLVFLVFLVIFFVPGFRGDTGIDTYSYQYYFNEVFNAWGSWKFIFLKEPVFYSIVYIISNFFGSFTFLLVVISFVQTFILFKVFSSLTNKYIFLFFYISIYFIDYHFNVLRASLALLFFLYSLSLMGCGRLKASYVMLLFSIFSHFSAIIFVPIFIACMKIGAPRKLLLLFVSFIFFCIFYLTFHKYLEEKLILYGLISIPDFEFSIVATLFSFLIFSSFLTVKSIPGSLLFTTFYFLALFCSVMIFNYASRLYLMVFAVLFYMLCEHGFFSRRLGQNFLYVAAISSLAIWFCISSFVSIYNERERIVGDERVRAEAQSYTFVPYNFFYESDSR